MNQRGEIRHVLGGVERAFRATLGALDQAESLSGEKVADWLSTTFSVRGVRAVIRATCTPAMTEEETDGLIEALGFANALDLARQILLAGVLGREEYDLLFPELDEKKTKAVMEDGHGGD